MVTMVKQGLTLKARAAEIVVCAVEAAAAPRVAVASNISQTRALVAHVSGASIRSGSEGLATVATLLARTVLLLLPWARRW